MPTPTLRDVIELLDHRYPPGWAASWDAVGLTCGDPGAEVERILFAVDPTHAVVDEALATGADLLVTHHPLLLTPTSSIAADTAKGRIVHRLIKGGCGLFTAHTNADVARPGVSDALAAALGLVDVQPLETGPVDATDKVVVFVPETHADAVIDALTAAGAGSIGAYERCAWSTSGSGTFEPGPQATPAIGLPGHREVVPEARIEMLLPRSRRAAVVAALREAHPYEEPAFDIYERADPGGGRGLGRIGALPEPMDLSAFVALIADSLPVGAGGVRATGDPHRSLSRIAVCGGAGDSLLALAGKSGVDAYVTGDLRHHRVSEFVDATGGDGPALIDATHFGTEFPWLGQAAALLAQDCRDAGATVEIAVSSVITDPWTAHGADERSPS